MGGDEFVIITAAPDLARRFERAIELFSRREGPGSAAAPDVTVSLGAARVEGGVIPLLDILYVAADQALYAAKAAGPGKMVEVELHPPVMEVAA
jgi:GGDEF domain-containing protein